MLSRVARQAVRAVGSRSLHVTRPAARIYDSVLDTIGDTPVVRLNSVPTRKDVTVYAKLEYVMLVVERRNVFLICLAGSETGNWKLTVECVAHET